MRRLKNVLDSPKGASEKAIRIFIYLIGGAFGAFGIISFVWFYWIIFG